MVRIFVLLSLLMGVSACSITPRSLTGRSLTHWEFVGEKPPAEGTVDDWDGVECTADDRRLVDISVNRLFQSDPLAAPSRSEIDLGFDEVLPEAIGLSQISYCKVSEKQSRFRWDDGIWMGRVRTTRFYRDQFDVAATYHHPGTNIFFRDPNVFLLGRPASNRVVIVLLGTEGGANPLDNLKNIRASLKDDSPARIPKVEGRRIYIPSGHGGFRSSARNLIQRGVFNRRGLLADVTSVEELERHCADENRWRGRFNSSYGTLSLADFICKNKIRPNGSREPVRVVIIGHSLGAGIAQMLAGGIHGLHWEQGEDDAWSVVSGDSPEGSPSQRWPFDLERLYLIAPPLALYTRELVKKGCFPLAELQESQPSRFAGFTDPIKTYDRLGVTAQTSIVFRNGDMVPSLWSPLKGNCVVGQHFASIAYFIQRDGEVRVEDLRDQLEANVPTLEQYLLLSEPHTPNNHRIPMLEWAKELLED
ncbi:hypothetical protein HK107_07675 [Parvularcula sp. ZS-1/3]|uniref:Alpha/beta hydrolase n=1 Tax=Parvularcula mediterranea TaxID=2732508 RepID=A0A7Y3RMW1_9PROT|nr:hypothetical protein [Parvularcula mediterranea]NNU16197.1 hypothetical protein [Parvularcula mediterranea]